MHLRTYNNNNNKFKLCKKEVLKLYMVSHACIPSTRKMQAGGPGIQGEPGLLEILSLKKMFSLELFIMECSYFLIHLHI